MKPILLVEDNPNDLELTLLALRKTSLANQIVVVRDGAEALDYMFCRGQHADRTSGTPAVILLDLKLPKIDGLQVLEQLKQDPQSKTVPVVMLTASREESDLVKSYDLGVNAYVVKPIDFKTFVNAVQELGTFWAVLNESPPGGAKAHP